MNGKYFQIDKQSQCCRPLDKWVILDGRQVTLKLCVSECVRVRESEAERVCVYMHLGDKKGEKIKFKCNKWKKETRKKEQKGGGAD